MKRGKSPKRERKEEKMKDDKGIEQGKKSQQASRRYIEIYSYNRERNGMDRKESE